MTDMTMGARPRVLVSAASKHGATGEIAHHIATVLATKGLDVTETSPEEVADPGAFDLIVLGSAVYAGRWMKEAKHLAERIGRCDPRPAVWLFSSGPVGDPPLPDEDPPDAIAMMGVTGAHEHRVFSGKIDKSKLSFGEKAIVTAVHATEGDFRQWPVITEWSDAIAGALQMGAIR
jgi:menaquinone-dependent protoporphyrinogen oxidase